MKLAKTLAIVACAGLLSAGVLGSVRHAQAQDAPEGAWSAGGTGSADVESSPDSKGIPLLLGGCWNGDVQDSADGTGSASFEFIQNTSGKKLVTGSTFDFEWPDSTFAEGPIEGTVSSKGIKFHGNAGKGCSMHGSMTGDASALTGKVKFGGECAKFFKHVVISISPCI